MYPLVVEAYSSRISFRRRKIRSGAKASVRSVHVYDAAFPAGAVQPYTAQAGDALDSIAGALYGNSSLWYPLADANGLNRGETLKAGQVLRVRVKDASGTIISETHTIYNPGEIIGGTLPNLAAPPPKKSGCSGILTILVVIVAVVVVDDLYGGRGSRADGSDYRRLYSHHGKSHADS